MFGLLRDVHVWSTVGVERRIWVPVRHFAPFPGSVNMAFTPSSWGSRPGSSPYRTSAQLILCSIRLFRLLTHRELSEQCSTSRLTWAVYRCVIVNDSGCRPNGWRVTGHRYEYRCSFL